MKKIVLFLAFLAIITVPAISLAEESAEFDLSQNYTAVDASQNTIELAAKIIAIKEQYLPNKNDIYYFEVDVINTTMKVYRIVNDYAGMIFGLELLSEHLVGTPKSNSYPKGFGIITSTEFNPYWMPTDSTVAELRKHGINLEKFRNRNGKVVVPPGNRLNFMGPVKMSIQFITPQKNGRMSRNVYRIHGILPSLKSKLGTRCSGGCIRVANDEIKALANMTRDAAVIIQYI